DPLSRSSFYLSRPSHPAKSPAAQTDTSTAARAEPRTHSDRSMNQQLVERIKQCQNLPSLPAIAIQVLDLAQRADVGIAEIAQIISRDPALSGKILRT